VSEFDTQSVVELMTTGGSARTGNGNGDGNRTLPATPGVSTGSEG
jgi:hypothetical protein